MKNFIGFIFLMVFLLMTNFSSSQGLEATSIMNELEDSMSGMQETLNKIARADDPADKQSLMEKHFSDLQAHLLILKKMIGNQRLMGIKSTKQRMVARMEEMRNILGSTLNQMKGHYSACQVSKCSEDTEKNE